MTPVEAMEDTPARQAARSGPPVATGKRRLRRKLFILGLVVVLASGGVFGAKVLTYRPIEFAVDGGVQFPDVPGQTLRNPDDRQTNAIRSAEKNGIVIRYRENGRFSVDFDIRNRGDWEVVVSSLPPPPPEGSLVVLEGVHMAKTINQIGVSPMVPFRAFTLKPDDLRHLEFRYRFVDCFASPTDEDWATNQGSFYGIGPQKVEYQVFRVPRRVKLEQPYEILFHFTTPPDSAECRGNRN